MVSGRRYSGPLPNFTPPSADSLRPRAPSGPSTSHRLFRRNRTLALVGFFGILILFFLSRGNGRPQKHTNVDWNRYAYSLYATDGATLCNAVMVLEALSRLGSKAQRVLWYPRSWDTIVHDSADRESQLLLLASKKYGAHLQPSKMMAVQGFRTPDHPKKTWDDTVNKLFAFDLTHFHRVIYLDSDVTLLQNLDDLFFFPHARVAMPRAYWVEADPAPLTSQLMLVTPSSAEFRAMRDIISEGAEPSVVTSHNYTVDLLKQRYGEDELVLPHRPYALQSNEFRRHDHGAYLGDSQAEWDTQKIMEEAKMIHFNDPPLPKPWIMWPEEGQVEMQPDCQGESSCLERTTWIDLYEEFRERRKDVCKLLPGYAPDWEESKKSGEEDGKGGEKADGGYVEQDLRTVEHDGVTL